MKYLTLFYKVIGVDNDPIQRLNNDGSKEILSFAEILKITIASMPYQGLTMEDSATGGGIINKIAKLEDDAERLELESHEYRWLKKSLEKQLPKTWGFNGNLIIELFNDNISNDKDENAYKDEKTKEDAEA